jgi:alpha-mannosidase
MPMMNLTGNDRQFGQAGRRDWTFHYRIVLVNGPWDPVVPLVAAQKLRTPPFLQAPGTAPSVPGLASLAIDFAGGPVLACKMGEDDKRLIVRLWNVRSEPCDGSLQLPQGFKRAEECDALERPSGAVPVRDRRIRFTAGPRSIVTVALCRD